LRGICGAGTLAARDGCALGSAPGLDEGGPRLLALLKPGDPLPRPTCFSTNGAGWGPGRRATVWGAGGQGACAVHRKQSGGGGRSKDGKGRRAAGIGVGGPGWRHGSKGHRGWMAVSREEARASRKRGGHRAGWRSRGLGGGDGAARVPGVDEDTGSGVVRSVVNGEVRPAVTGAPCARLLADARRLSARNPGGLRRAVARELPSHPPTHPVTGALRALLGRATGAPGDSPS
jgi:hypothetical protein